MRSSLPLQTRLSMLAIVAAFFGAHEASAQTVYGVVTCDTIAGPCDECVGGPGTCNIPGQTGGTILGCATGTLLSGIGAGDVTAVVSSPSIYLLHWGSYWTSNAGEAAADVKAWQTIGKDWRFWQPLSQYSPTISYGPGSAIPFGASTVSTAIPAAAAASATNSVYIPDYQIQAELENEMTHSAIPMTDGHKIYVVVLPPYVQGDYGFTGYHQWTSLNGVSLPYAVISEAAPPVASHNPLYLNATWRPRDTLISHEVYEAVSDPLQTAWSTGTCGSSTEIADLCESFFSNPIDGYSIATFWSNQAKGCIGPVDLDTSNPPTPTTGCGKVCNVNHDTLAEACSTFAPCPLTCPPGKGDCGGYCCHCSGTTCS